MTYRRHLPLLLETEQSVAPESGGDRADSIPVGNTRNHSRKRQRHAHLEPRTVRKAVPTAAGASLEHDRRRQRPLRFATDLSLTPIATLILDGRRGPT
ncbi:hypothetical protein [Natronorubrum halophilum]|uniref:hypothetical protein n=1 Tax=Natronorubrum halophilum TaxID=1702106 RepID=UPI0010C238CB|nr:hypothetical protein [Natronorubrum halophilum]